MVWAKPSGALINSACSVRDSERGEQTAIAVDNCEEYHGEHHGEHHEARQQYAWQQEHPLDNPTPVHRTIFWRLSCIPQGSTSRLPAYHVSQHSARLHWTLGRHRSNRARMIITSQRHAPRLQCVSQLFNHEGMVIFVFCGYLLRILSPGIHIRLSAA